MHTSNAPYTRTQNKTLTSATACSGMPCVTGYRTWFYYVVRGVKRDLSLTMTVTNMNPQVQPKP
jgi:hypothetical protein